MNKTQLKLLDQGSVGYAVVGLDQPRKLAAARQLEALGLVTIEVESNEYGHQWLRVTTIKERN